MVYGLVKEGLGGRGGRGYNRCFTNVAVVGSLDFFGSTGRRHQPWLVHKNKRHRPPQPTACVFTSNRTLHRFISLTGLHSDTTTTNTPTRR